MVAGLGTQTGGPEVRQVPLSAAWRQVADERPLAAADNLPHLRGHFPDVLVAVALVAEVLLDIVDVCLQRPFGMLLKRIKLAIFFPFLSLSSLES